MTSKDLLELLGAHWVSVLAELDDEERTELAGCLRALHEAAGAGQPRAVAREFRRLRRALSALPPGHPVAEVLEERRYAAGDQIMPSLAAIDGVLDLLGDPPPGPEELRRAARERLLSVPALTAREFADLVPDPPDPGGLIRLSDPECGSRYPRFQFRPGTAEPLPVVRRINDVLQADRDPWGAADWWLGDNSWLHGVPAELLGTLPDDQLELAAVELVEGD
ncbi:hypothetical protein ABZ876_16450 [Streptomyces sp. NPDC046931]|uniref:hypothetical protein n=1 Tax=Streptomyces sp. NPDC046931 TaxID=3154806 RepID=UPI0033E6633D